MYSYPYAASLPPMLTWAGDTVGVVLMVTGLIVAVTLITLARHAGRERVERTAPILTILSDFVRLPRAAA